MAGYGNKTALDPNVEGDDTKFSHLDNVSSYQGGHPERGSGTTGGAGFGNKSAPSTGLDDYDDGGSRFGDKLTNAPYSGGHPDYGSGSTGGAGWGNKSTSDGFGGDSRLGKMVEQVGQKLNKPSLVEKGQDMRAKKNLAAEGTDDQNDLLETQSRAV